MVHLPYVIDGHKKKIHTNSQIFLKISLVVMIEVVNLSVRVVIDFFFIFTKKYLIKKKLRLISLCPKLYLQ